jgi:hypothetical protein
VLAIVQSLRTIDVIPEFLYDAPAQMADLLNRMWPISWRSFPGSIQRALIETLHMATLGTILAVIMAVPVGLAAANNLTPNRAVNFLARLILVSSRSINSLVWALLFIAIFGPGPLAGTIAIAFRSIGFVAQDQGFAQLRKDGFGRGVLVDGKVEFRPRARVVDLDAGHFVGAPQLDGLHPVAPLLAQTQRNVGSGEFPVVGIEIAGAQGDGPGPRGTQLFLKRRPAGLGDVKLQFSLDHGWVFNIADSERQFRVATCAPG